MTKQRRNDEERNDVDDEYEVDQSRDSSTNGHLRPPAIDPEQFFVHPLSSSHRYNGHPAEVVIDMTNVLAGKDATRNLAVKQVVDMKELQKLESRWVEERARLRGIDPSRVKSTAGPRAADMTSFRHLGGPASTVASASHNTGLLGGPTMAGAFAGFGLSGPSQTATASAASVESTHQQQQQQDSTQTQAGISDGYNSNHNNNNPSQHRNVGGLSIAPGLFSSASTSPLHDPANFHSPAFVGYTAPSSSLDPTAGVALGHPTRPSGGGGSQRIPEASEHSTHRTGKREDESPSHSLSHHEEASERSPSNTPTPSPEQPNEDENRVDEDEPNVVGADEESEDHPPPSTTAHDITSASQHDTTAPIAESSFTLSPPTPTETLHSAASQDGTTETEKQ